MWELVGRHEPHQHTDGRRTKYFNFLVPCNPLLGFRDEVRATRRDSERDDSAKTRRIMRASPGMNDLERAFVEFERADAAEADVAALRAEEQAVLASAGCKTMVELAAKLQSLKDASGAEALHDAVEAPRGTAAAAAANGPPALKPGLKPLRYEDCLDGNIEKQIRGSTPNSAPSHSTPSLPATRRARLLAGLGGPGPGPGWSILKLKIILNTARSKKALKFCCFLVSLLIRLAEYAGGFRRLLVTQGARCCSRNGSWQQGPIGRNNKQTNKYKEHTHTPPKTTIHCRCYFRTYHFHFHSPEWDSKSVEGAMPMAIRPPPPPSAEVADTRLQLARRHFDESCCSSWQASLCAA